MRIEKDQLRALLVLSALTLLFVCGLWLPYHFRMRQLQQRIDAAQKQFAADQQATKNLVSLAADVMELKEILSGAQKYVPEQNELADLLKQLSADMQAAAGRSDTAGGRIYDQEIQTGAITNYANYSILPVTLRFKGSYQALDSFLRRIEAMNRLVRIDKLEVQGKPRSSTDPKATQPAASVIQSPVLSVFIELSAFFSPASAAMQETPDNTRRARP